MVTNPINCLLFKPDCGYTLSAFNLIVIYSSYNCKKKEIKIGSNTRTSNFIHHLKNTEWQTSGSLTSYNVIQNIEIINSFSIYPLYEMRNYYSYPIGSQLGASKFICINWQRESEWSKIFLHNIIYNVITSYIVHTYMITCCDWYD